MNITKALKELQEGKDVELVMRYYGDEQRVLFESKIYGDPLRAPAFKHRVGCEKDDFKQDVTHYRGSKSDCRFKFITKDD